MKEFHDYLQTKELPFTEADFTKDHDWLTRQLTMAMLWSGLSDDDSRAYEYATDPEVLKAVESLPKAQALLNSANKLIVQRRMK